MSSTTVKVDNPTDYSQALDLLHELKGGEDHLTGEVVEETPTTVTVNIVATIHKDWLA